MREATTSTDTVEETVEQLRAQLLSSGQQLHYQDRIAELQAALVSLQLAGTAEEISLNIGTFHFLKGKIETFNELLDDHRAAASQLQAG